MISRILLAVFLVVCCVAEEPPPFEVRQLTEEEYQSIQVREGALQQAVERFEQAQEELRKAKELRNLVVGSIKRKAGELGGSCEGGWGSLTWGGSRKVGFVSVTIKGRYVLIERGERTCPGVGIIWNDASTHIGQYPINGTNPD